MQGTFLEPLYPLLPGRFVTIEARPLQGKETWKPRLRKPTGTRQGFRYRQSVDIQFGAAVRRSLKSQGTAHAPRQEAGIS